MLIASSGSRTHYIIYGTWYCLTLWILSCCILQALDPSAERTSAAPFASSSYVSFRYKLVNFFVFCDLSAYWIGCSQRVYPAAHSESTDSIVIMSSLTTQCDLRTIVKCENTFYNNTIVWNYGHLIWTLSYANYVITVFFLCSGGNKRRVLSAMKFG